MKKNRFENLSVISSEIKYWRIILLCEALCLFMALGTLNAQPAPKKIRGIVSREALSPEYDLVKLKSDKVLIMVHNSDQPVFNQKFEQLYAYNYLSDSVLWLESKRQSYTFSMKTGALSKPYVSIGEPGAGSNSNLVACLNNNGMYGFLDCHTGMEVIPCQFEASEYHKDKLDFHCFSPQFKHNFCLIQNPDSDSLDRFIDTTGRVVLRSGYISKCDYYDGYIVDDDIPEKLDTRKSLYSVDLKCVLSDKKYIHSFRAGIVYQDSIHDETMMLISPLYPQAIPVYSVIDIGECEALLDMSRSKENESKDVYFAFETDYGLGVGVMDQNLNLIIDPKWKWENVVSFGNGYFLVYAEWGGPAFIMDRNGKFVLPKRVSASPIAQ